MPRRRLTEDEKHARKVAREIETTLRQMSPEYQERQRESHRKQQARWAKENPECISEAQRKWRDKQDPELFRQYDRDRYAMNAAKRKARSRAYYEANRERINAKRRAKAAVTGSTSPVSTLDRSRESKSPVG